MKNIIYLLSIILLSACGQGNKENTSTITEDAPTEIMAKNQILVYDFHTTHRCETCLKIENATKETLNENFKAELAEELITFSLFNADAEENELLAEEYGAYGTTLAISIVKDGNKEILDITNWAFEAIHGDNFKTELTAQLNEALAQL